MIMFCCFTIETEQTLFSILDSFKQPDKILNANNPQISSSSHLPSAASIHGHPSTSSTSNLVPSSKQKKFGIIKGIAKRSRSIQYTECPRKY